MCVCMAGGNCPKPLFITTRISWHFSVRQWYHSVLQYSLFHCQEMSLWVNTKSPVLLSRPKLGRICLFVLDPRTLLTLCICFIVYVIKEWNLKTKPSSHLDNVASTVRYDFQITKTWDDKPVDHLPVNISLVSHSDVGVKVLLKAPFFNDPVAPSGTPGEPFSHLWDYEGQSVTWNLIIYQFCF